MEIIGLVIIVLLISLGVLLITQFALTKKPDIKKTYVQSQLSSNMLSAMLKTTTDCNSQTITQLLQNCAENPDAYCADSQPYCDYIKNEVNYFLDNTLRKWNTNFILTALIPGRDPIINEKNGDCTGSAKSSTFPLNVGAETIMYIKLDICD